jgi:hypothetical protein
MTAGLGLGRLRGLQRDVVYSWLTSCILYMSPNAEGWGRGELRDLGQWLQLYTGAQINFEDVTQYLIYWQASPRFLQRLYSMRNMVYAEVYYNHTSYWLQRICHGLPYTQCQSRPSPCARVDSMPNQELRICPLCSVSGILIVGYRNGGVYVADIVFSWAILLALYS